MQKKGHPALWSRQAGLPSRHNFRRRVNKLARQAGTQTCDAPRPQGGASAKLSGQPFYPSKIAALGCTAMGLKPYNPQNI